MKLFLALALLCSVALAQSPSGSPAGTKALGDECMATSECGEGMCCVTKMFGIGRKKRFLFFGNDNDVGHCMKERVENESCHVFIGKDPFHPGMYDDYCPCMAGLECRGETVDESGHSVVHHNPKCQPGKAATGN